MPTSNQYPEYKPLILSIRDTLYSNWKIDTEHYDKDSIFFNKSGDLLMILLYNSHNGSQIKIENIVYNEDYKFVLGDIFLC